MAAEFIRQLPRVSKKDLNNDSCSICFREYETTPSSDEASEIAIRLPCGHVMGLECISTWLLAEAGGRNNSCPYCRRKLFSLPEYPLIEGFNHLEEARRLLFATDARTEQNPLSQYPHDYLQRRFETSRELSDRLQANLDYHWSNRLHNLRNRATSRVRAEREYREYQTRLSRSSNAMPSHDSSNDRRPPTIPHAWTNTYRSFTESSGAFGPRPPPSPMPAQITGRQPQSNVYFSPFPPPNDPFWRESPMDHLPSPDWSTRPPQPWPVPRHSHNSSVSGPQITSPRRPLTRSSARRNTIFPPGHFAGESHYPPHSPIPQLTTPYYTPPFLPNGPTISNPGPHHSHVADQPRVNTFNTFEDQLGDVARQFQEADLAAASVEWCPPYSRPPRPGVPEYERMLAQYRLLRSSGRGDTRS